MSLSKTYYVHHQGLLSVLENLSFLQTWMREAPAWVQSLRREIPWKQGRHWREQRTNVELGNLSQVRLWGRKADHLALITNFFLPTLFLCCKVCNGWLCSPIVQGTFVFVFKISKGRSLLFLPLLRNEAKKLWINLRPLW